MGEDIKRSIIGVRDIFMDNCDDCIDQIKDECDVLKYFKISNEL